MRAHHYRRTKRVQRTHPFGPLGTACWRFPWRKFWMDLFRDLSASFERIVQITLKPRELLAYVRWSELSEEAD